MNRLAGRVAIVSGGASGIGRASAIRLAQEGAHVVVADIDSELGLQTCTDIEANGGIARFQTLDVTEENQWQACVADTVSQTVEQVSGVDDLTRHPRSAPRVSRELAAVGAVARRAG